MKTKSIDGSIMLSGSVFLVVALMFVVGCATFSNQGMRERITTTEYDSDGNVVSITVSDFKLRDVVTAAPWQGQAGTEHAITYTQTGEGMWTISFGGKNDLTGGDIAVLAAELTKALETLKPLAIP